MIRRVQEKRRGSALILTLILTGILALSTAAMLKSVRHMTHATDDKVAYEEAYVVGLSGLAAAKAWLMDPELASSQLGEMSGNRFEAITAGALSLSCHVRAHSDETTSLKEMTGRTILGYYTAVDATLGGHGTLDGDRRVLWEFTGTDDRLVRFRNGRPADSLFGGSSSARSFVRKLRISTPFRSSGSSAVGPFLADDLRRVSLILEAEAVTLGSGVPKVRVLQQKVLIVPEVAKNTAPGLAPGAAVAAAGGDGIAVGGESSLSVHWAPAWSTRNIELLDLTLNAAAPVKSLKGGKKFIGAGIDAAKVGSDKWLKWQTSGLLTDTNGTPILRDAASSDTNPTINGQPVTDFFVQVLNGSFGSDWTPDKLRLDGDYIWNDPGEWAKQHTGQGILYDPIPDGGTQYPIGSGALVQMDPSVATRINSLIENDLNYPTWKAYAIANNGYVRPAGTEANPYFVNNDGQQLYVGADGTLTTNPAAGPALTTLDQLSMASLIPNPSRNTSSIPDRILFVDTKDGTQQGALGKVSLSGQFFWKGLFYCMADVDASGVAAGQSVLMKDPDEYHFDPTGDSRGSVKKSCLMDGVLFTAGTYTRSGNGCIYGSLICQGGFSGAGSPDIYYNTRNRYGLFKDPGGGPNASKLQELVSGPISENNLYAQAGN